MQRKKWIFLAILSTLMILTGCTEKEQGMLLQETREEQDSILEEGEEPPAIETTKMFLEEEKKSCIYICGCVKEPGIYELPSPVRVYQVIEKAGGLLEEAAAEGINQAQVVEDGTQITIWSKEEIRQMEEAGEDISFFLSAGEEFYDKTQKESSEDTSSEDKQEKNGVNINTAEEEQLMTISGIGQVRARAILAYRKEHGAFSSIEELKQVEGIKEGLFEKIKDQINIE